MEPGESWAYRARGVDPLVEVRVIRHGNKKPARVLVAFVDDAFEGREEWVPPARLKVPWDQAEEFEARETRWNRVASAGLPQDDPLSFAASEVIDEYLDEELATINYGRGGDSIALRKPELLAEQLSLEVEQLAEYPEAFTEDGVVIAPWPVTELIAKRLAERHAEKILQRVEKEERQARHEAIYGRASSYSRGSGHISPEIAAEIDQELNAPVREILRSWCGAESVNQFDELIALRKEIKRVGDLAQEMIGALRTHGHESVAANFEHELGMSVDEL